jgi:hypothetical protein
MAVLFYDPDNLNSVYQKDMINQFKIQSDLLNISYKVLSLDDKNYILKPNTVLFIIANLAALQKYITKSFLNKIKSNSFIFLTDTAEDVSDIFGHVPAIVTLFWPLDYTSTSQDIYDYVNIKNAIPEIYAIYQIIYSLAKITLIPGFFQRKFSMTEYLNFNSFNSIPPPWVYSDSFDINKKGILYAHYAFLFTKNVFFEGKEDLFFKNFLGGNPLLPNSQSLFSQMAISPWFVSGLTTQINIPIYIYHNEKLIIVRNSLDTTRIETNQISENCNNESGIYEYKYNDDEYFSVLNFLSTKKKVNSTMSICIEKLCYKIF